MRKGSSDFHTVNEGFTPKVKPSLVLSHLQTNCLHVDNFMKNSSQKLVCFGGEFLYLAEI
jgi:hypothetical protein